MRFSMSKGRGTDDAQRTVPMQGHQGGSRDRKATKTCGLLGVLASMILADAHECSVPDTSPSTALPSPSLAPEPGTFGALPIIVLEEMTSSLVNRSTVSMSGSTRCCSRWGCLRTAGWRSRRGSWMCSMIRIGTSGQDSYWEVGGYVSWAAVYTSDADAETAFEVLVAEHEADVGGDGSRRTLSVWG